MRYETADLVVVGGGALGALAALQGLKLGMSALLIDRAEPGPSPHAAVGPYLRSAYGNPFPVRLARAAREGWAPYEDFLHKEEFLDLAPPHSPVLEALELTMEQEARPYRSLHDLNREGWEDLRPPLALWGVLSDCWRLDATALWGVLWREAQQRGVRCFADTEIQFLDLEYDRPTAVARDTAFRGRTMVVTASPLLHAPERRQLWRRSQRPARCPNLHVHFAQVPVRLLRGYQVARLHAADPPADEVEEERLQDFVDRFLPEAPPLEESFPYLYTPGQQGPHPLRPDVVVAIGQPLGLAPAVARLSVEQCAGLEPFLGAADSAASKPAEDGAAAKSQTPAAG